MTELTREQVAALLDGIGAGVPEEKFDEELGSMVLTSEGVNMICARMDLYRAAPDLARQLLAAMDRLADADMAQAALVERAIYPCSYDVPDNLTYDEAQMFRAGAEAAIDAVAAAIRALAPDAGVKAVAELRAERDALKAQKWDVQHTDTMNDMVSLGMERDRLAADNANLQARFEKLRGHLGYIAETSDLEGYEPGMWAINRARTALAEDDMLVSALATREAWKGILPGGEG